MTDFDAFDDFAEDAGRPMSAAEKERVRDRLMRLNEDPVRIDVGDREVVDFTERQFGRIIGDDGQPVRKDFERFRPSVGRDDLFLFGSVGDDADNAPEDVFKVKKLLQRAAGTEFRPGLEGLGEADPQTVNTLRNIQGTNNLKVDGRVEPGGPTLHALGVRALGPEDGRPTPLAAHEFETRFGKPADKDERGKPITPKASISNPGNRPAVEIRLAATSKRGRRKMVEEFIRRLWRKHGKPSNPQKLPKDHPPKNDDFVERPAMVFRYPDGRVYLNIWNDGTIHRLPTAGGPHIRKIDPRRPETMRSVKGFNRNLPDLGDKRTHEERRAAGLEGYVYGPVFNKAGKIVAYVPLFDPSTIPFFGSFPTFSIFARTRLLRSPTGKDVFLTMKQIRELGLLSWYSRTRKPRVE